MKINNPQSRGVLLTSLAILVAFSCLSTRSHAALPIEELEVDLQLVVGEQGMEQIIEDWEHGYYGENPDVWYVWYVQDEVEFEQAFEGSLFQDVSTGDYYVGLADGMVELLTEDDPEEETGDYYTQAELDELLEEAKSEGYEEGYGVGRDAGLKAGRREVLGNPGKFKLYAAQSIPSEILISTPRGNVVTVALQGEWSRFAASGAPRGWKFDEKTGQLTGKVQRRGEVTLRASQKNSPGLPLKIIFEPAKK